jgi:hypothetical protein
MSSYTHFETHLKRVFETEFGKSELKTTPMPENPSYTDEEYRLLKAFISGQLTKYVNNLKVDSDSVPFMYDQSQSIIGVATFIFYIFMSPYVIDILSEQFAANPTSFEELLFDKYFRNVWLYGGSTQHVMNVSHGTKGSVAGTGFDPSVFQTNSALKEAVESIYNLVIMPDHIDISEAPHGETSIVDFEQILKNRIERVHADMTAQISALGETWRDMMTYAKQNFYTRMAEIRSACMFEPGSKINKDGILSIMELMRTIFTFYFKGGNSIREISQRVNNLVSDIYKVNTIDESIPYGSDFDTNFLINPYLPKATIEKIKVLIEVFIPQISQYIRLHPSFHKPLSEVKRELFVGKEGEKKDEQQLQMQIIIDSYRNLVMNYLPSNKKRKLERLHRPNFDGPVMKITPQVKKDGTIVRSQLLYCWDKTTTKQCSQSTHVKHSETFPSLSGLNCEIPVNNDYCFGCLQYSINKTIPRFDLHRYFLKFNFHTIFQKTNAKNRLINVADGAYNCELLDISIVNPVYVMDSQNKISCELVELWNNSNDIFKMEVYDKYNLGSTLITTPILGDRPFVEADYFEYFTVFVNGIKMQVDDLSLAVKDSVLQGKLDKVSKRIKRLRLLNYIQIISGIYPVEAFKDIVINAKLVDFDIPLYENDSQFVNLLSESIQAWGGIGREYTKTDIKYINTIYEYISAHIHSQVFTLMINDLPVQVTYNGVSQSLTLFQIFYYIGGLVLKESIKTNPDYNTMISVYNNFLIQMYKQLLFFSFDIKSEVVLGDLLEFEIAFGTHRFQFKAQKHFIRYNDFNILLGSIIKNIYLEKEKKIHNFKIPSLLLVLLASSENNIITDQSTFLSHLSEDTKRIVNSIFGQVIHISTGSMDIEIPTMLNISNIIPSTSQIHVSYEAEEIQKSKLNQDIAMCLTQVCSSLSEMCNILDFNTIISTNYRFLLNDEYVNILINLVTFGYSKKLLSSIDLISRKYLELIGSHYKQQADVSRMFDARPFLEAAVGSQGTRIELDYTIQFPMGLGEITIDFTLYYNHYMTIQFFSMGISALVYSTSRRYMTDNIYFIYYPNGTVELIYSFNAGDEELAKNVNNGGNLTIQFTTLHTLNPTKYSLYMTPDESIPSIQHVLLYNGYGNFILSRLKGVLVVKPPSMPFLSNLSYSFVSSGGGRIRRSKKSRKATKRKFKKHTIKRTRK